MQQPMPQSRRSGALPRSTGIDRMMRWQSFAHIQWIRLLARLLRPVNLLDLKEHFHPAQKCGVWPRRRKAAHPAVLAARWSAPEIAQTSPDGNGTLAMTHGLPQRESSAHILWITL
jgi:hypothetical protein